MTKNRYLQDLLRESSPTARIEIARWQFLEEVFYFCGKIFLIWLLVYLFGRYADIIFNFTQKLSLDTNLADLKYYIVSGFALIPLFNTLKEFPHLFYSLSIRVYATPKYIIYKEGFYNKKVEKIFLSNIDNIDFTYTKLGKIFNYGTIHLTNAGGTVSLFHIKNNKRNYNKLKVLIEISNRK